MTKIHEVFEAAANLSKLRGWDKGWSAGGCYLHLESSEFIESLRGKGGDPVDEAGDVLCALFTMLAEANIRIDDVLDRLEAKIGVHTEDAMRNYYFIELTDPDKNIYYDVCAEEGKVTPDPSFATARNKEVTHIRTNVILGPSLTPGGWTLRVVSREIALQEYETR